MIDQNLFFAHFPEPIRTQKLAGVKGFQVIRMPVAYSVRIQQSPLWEVVVPVDKEGYTVKAAPDNLISKAIKTMEKYQQFYELDFIK